MRVRGRRLLLVVNPYAGWGGLLGYPGSDGLPLPPVSRGPAHRAMVAFLRELRALSGRGLEELPLVPAPGALGEWALQEALGRWEPSPATRAPDKEEALGEMKRFAERECGGRGDLLVFSGGDGTAYVLARHWGCGAPMLGVPGGSKMYSEVFALSPRYAAMGAIGFLWGDAGVGEALVTLVDEEALNRGEWRVVDQVLVPSVEAPGMVRQESKDPRSWSPEEVDLLVDHLVGEVLETGAPVVVGPGGILTRLAERLGWAKPFAGFAAGFVGGEVFCQGCSSVELHRFATSLGQGSRGARVLLSPLGRSGFLLGRATRALTPNTLVVLGGADSLLAVSPPSKLSRLRELMVDASYAKALGGRRYLRLLAGPGEYWVLPLRYV